METRGDAERPLEGSCDQPMEIDEDIPTAALDPYRFSDEVELAAEQISDAPWNGAESWDGEQEGCSWRPSGCYTLCGVCNLQINSEAQAQVHFNGNAHRRRLRQLTAQSGTAGEEENSGRCRAVSCLSEHHSPAVPGHLVSPPDMDVKPFVSFPLGATGTVGLFPNFSTMDPVQKAVINHTFGLPVQPRKRQLITCNICQVRFNSQNQAEAHYKGSKHCKKLKALEAMKARQSTECHGEITSSTPGCEGSQPLRASSPGAQQANGAVDGTREGAAGTAVTAGTAATSGVAAPPAPAPVAESDEEKAKRLLYCAVCKVAVNSQSQLDAHNNGARHKATLEGKEVRASGRPFPRHTGRNKAGKAGSSAPGAQAPTKNFHCQLCDVKVNSEMQLQQHIKSRRHKDKLTGKTSKPKFSPYNKAQRASNRSSLLAKLTFRKELLNSLGLSFLQSPLSVAAAAFQATNVHYTAKLALHKDLTRLPSAVTATGFLPSPLVTAAAAMRTPLTFHAAPAAAAAASLFPSHGLAQALLRPAPGPMRNSHGPIIFTPY